MDKVDGEVIDNGHTRWCGSCNQPHAILYICDQYSDELRLQIAKLLENFQDEIHDPGWIKGQLGKGIPQTVIRIMQTLVGKSNPGKKSNDNGE